ncbi:MAG: putative Na+/H+ antiporter [Leptospirales bacterium]
MKKFISLVLLLSALSMIPVAVFAGDPHHGGGEHSEGGAVEAHNSCKELPKPLSCYEDSHIESLTEKLWHRIDVEPFNLIASLIFLLAIMHTFVATKFTALAHKLEHNFRDKVNKKDKSGKQVYHAHGDVREEVHFGAEIAHFFGEVEAIFGLWVIVLTGAVLYYFDFHTIVDYISHRVNFTEPMFVVVIMTLSATRPIIRLAEQSLAQVARLGKSTHAAWWFTILTVGPILGSFVTEPAAMTISALLLARQFYHCKPAPLFAYATIGLLFVNISVGGTLSNFAAPPVLMVASPERWNWSFHFMFVSFGWKAVIGIFISNILYLAVFMKEFAKMAPKIEHDNLSEPIHWDERVEKVPVWITLIHLIFIGWTVFTAHYPALFIGGFLFYLGFADATAHHQNRTNLKPSLLVGFFLAGLVIHGGLQSWWIAPVLASLTEVPLMIGATILTAFNDNAAITYLATLVPPEVFTDSLKYAVVAGAVTGGGLTVIANAPNPAGRSILNDYFENGVSPLGLAAAAFVPTIIMGLCFMLL